MKNGFIWLFVDSSFTCVCIIFPFVVVCVEINKTLRNKHIKPQKETFNNEINDVMKQEVRYV